MTITDAAGTVIAEQNFDAWGRKRNPANWQYTAVPLTPAWLYRGYTSNEHLPHFTLINMNGRMYDPIQGRMLSPDNYVATPFGTQGYNRYTYANNNPLSYVDPDGNFPIIAAAIIGGFIKGMQYDMSGKGSFLGGFWRGALLGAAGGYAGTLAPIGILPGMAYGVGTGALLGGISAGLDGNNIWNGAMKGGILGGITGGIIGGIEAGGLNANIWTGQRPLEYTPVSLAGLPTGGASAPYSDEYLHSLYNTNYPNTKGMNWMSMKHAPKGTEFLPDGTWMYNKQNVLAITKGRVWKHGGISNVYFSRAAFASSERLAHTMAHELGHVTHNYLGLHSLGAEEQSHPEIGLRTESHRAIEKMTNRLNIINGWKVAQTADYMNYHLADDRLYNPLLFLIKKIILPQ